MESITTELGSERRCPRCREYWPTDFFSGEKCKGKFCVACCKELREEREWRVNHAPFDTGVIGVRGPYTRTRIRQRKTGAFPQTERFFQATWQEQTEAGWRKRKAHISITAHGYAQALSLAILTRRTKGKSA